MTLPRCRSLLFLIARARQTRKHPQIRSFSALSRIDYGATLSFRHSHSITDTPATKDATREHPIDIIEGETAIRRFRQHVEDGSYQDARSVMVDLVQNHELGGNLGLFRELRDIVIATDNTDYKLLADLGESLARAGHVRFVRDEIRPLFESESALSSLDRALTKIEEDGSSDRRTQSVFEEPSGDYILPTPASLMPSITDLVRANLPEFLPHPTDNDTSLFEDSSVEYPAVRELVEQDAPHRNSRILEQLITNKSFDQAFAMLQEMEALGSSIAPSVMFGDSAERALREGSIDEFLSWLAHVPPHREGDMSPYFQRIQRLLLQQATLDYPLLTKVVMLLAGKEYRPIVLRCLQEIIRDTESLPALKAVLHSVEEVAFRYYLTEDPTLAEERRQRYARFLLGVAVRVCSWEGRLAEAVALLPGDNDHNLFLTPPTYQILLKKLLNTTQQQWIRSAQECEARDLARLKAFHGEEYLPPRDSRETTAILPPTNIDDIDGYVRFFHDAIIHEPTAMHPHIIANFITSYIDQGYPVPGVLRALTEHAVRTSHSAMYAWTLGEMQYYRRRKEQQLIVKTFVDHFVLEGVPKEQVMKVYAKFTDARPTGPSSPPLRRVTGYDAGQVHRTKSWMGREHRALVWETLIHGAKTQRAVWNLYRSMIDILSQSQAQRAASHGQVVPLPLLGPEVFMMFFKHIGHGAEVNTLLGDMLRLGMQPSAYVYGHVLFVWARTGHKPRVLRMLKAVRDQYEQRAEPHPLNAHQQVPSAPDEDLDSMLHKPVDEWDFARLKLPPPDMTMYVSAMRGFIEREKLRGATATAKALARLMGMKNLQAADSLRKAPGNEDLDHWLNVLEDISSKRKSWRKKSGRTNK